MKFVLGDDIKEGRFNDLMLRYSFKIKCRDDLQRVREMQDKKQAMVIKKTLFKEYKQSYKPILMTRIASFETIAKKLSRLLSGDALEKYLSIRSDYFLMHDSLVLAAQEKYNEMMEVADKHVKSLTKSKNRQQ